MKNAESLLPCHCEDVPVAIHDRGTNSAVQGSQICQCEGASRPWQSREGTAVPYRPPFRGTRHCRGGACPSRCCTNDSHRLSLRWQPPPTGPVAALSERPVGSNSTAGGHWCTSRSPDVSLRGAKRRGNLGKAVAVSPVAFPRCGRVLRDCHVGLRPPRNDKSEAGAILTIACSGRQHCAGRGMPPPTIALL